MAGRSFAIFPTSSAPILRRILLAPLLCIAGPFLGMTLAWAQYPGSTDRNATRAATATSGSSTPSPKDQRAREGTEIVDELGRFRMTGDRVTFFPAHGRGQFVGLENLNLERIARTVADHPEPLQWSVTGTITEYRGTNFLLVRRALLKARVQSSRETF